MLLFDYRRYAVKVRDKNVKQMTAGDDGTAMAGDDGIATAGDKGTICLQYYDAKSDRYRMAVAYVGEDGILPNRKYKLNGSHEFVEVKR